MIPFPLQPELLEDPPAIFNQCVRLDPQFHPAAAHVESGLVVALVQKAQFNTDFRVGF